MARTVRYEVRHALTSEELVSAIRKISGVKSARLTRTERPFIVEVTYGAAPINLQRLQDELKSRLGPWVKVQAID